jgi:transposase
LINVGAQSAVDLNSHYSLFSPRKHLAQGESGIMTAHRMGAPLSLDLRNRAVEAYRSAEGTLEQLAGRFNIGIATLGRWLRRLREHGDIAPAPHRGGMPARIPDEQLEALLALVAEKPDRTAEELRQEWQRRTNIPLSRSAMVRALHRAGLSVKRTSFRASEQFRPDVMHRREETWLSWTIFLFTRTPALARCSSESGRACCSFRPTPPS